MSLEQNSSDIEPIKIACDRCFRTFDPDMLCLLHVAGPKLLCMVCARDAYVQIARFMQRHNYGKQDGTS